MTSSPIKGVGSLMGYTSMKTNGNVQDELTGNFTDAFSKATGQQGMTLQNDNLVKGSSQVKVNHTDKRGLDGQNTVNTGAKTVKKTNVTDAEAQDAVQKAGKELVGKVAEELGVPEEAVENAMETLGLTMVDLLNPENMTQLVLTLADADMLTLMTDEGLYNSLQDLLGMVIQQLDSLQEEFGISSEELTAMLEAMSEEVKNGRQPFEVTDGQMDMVQEQDVQEDYTVTVERDGETVKVSVEVDGSSKAESSAVTLQKAPASDEESAGSNAKEEGSQRDASAHNQQTQTNVLLEQLANRDNTWKTDAVFQDTMAGSTVDTQDIMNQIMNYMKVQVKADMTQMQIQLHPASLGTVNINIASKEGVITAQFLTQNEAVKAVIESQLVQLKTNFEEQGIKVEAVEVTVESHQFERNLSGESDNRQQTQDGKKKSVRRINLSELSTEEESNMNEEEQITVSMMNAGGSTVDFTA